MTQQRIVRIGGGSAGLGDGIVGIPQLLRGGELDYLMLDYLSEYFMPQAGRSRLRDPQTGYVPGFPDEIVALAGRDLAGKKVKIVTNAGAVNPRGCAAAIREAARRRDLDIKIAVVDGDDVIERASEFRKSGRLQSELPKGASYTTLNAYLGAFPIARALALGTDLVITGRVVDSALCLGPLIHEFGWRPEQYDLLAAGSLVGHILECGAQASGGIFTDWRQVGDYTDIGYPIAECRADGSAVITKAPGTGGLVSVGTVAEQLLYEIADPRSYHLPDVVCDFSNVRFEQLGPDRVRMTGAKGRPPGPNYKVNATWDDGWFASWGYAVRGQDAADRAKAIADAVLRRGARLLRERSLPALRRSRVEIIGDEESWGAHARTQGSREIFCRITIEAGDDKTFGILLRETGTGSVSMAPGIVGSLMMFNPVPMARLESFLIPASEVPARITIDDRTETHERAESPPLVAAPEAAAAPTPDRATDTTVPLRQLAWARSGDKADVCNIGIVARKPEYLPYIAAAMDEAAVARQYAFILSDDGAVERHYLPGSHALNFLLSGALDGGCTVSLCLDPFGKSAAQDALDMSIPVPASLLP
jgi:hypothetical protein